jgi:hypothetical protein
MLQSNHLVTARLHIKVKYLYIAGSIGVIKWFFSASCYYTSYVVAGTD